MAPYHLPCPIIATGHTDTCHLKTVRKAVMDEDTSRQREHLRLVLQSAKRCREDETVIVSLEFRAVIMTLRVAILLSEALCGYELLPVHAIRCKVHLLTPKASLRFRKSSFHQPCQRVACSQCPSLCPFPSCSGH